MNKRVVDLVRERNRLRKHNRQLINSLDHYFEIVHHAYSKRRAKKLERKLPFVPTYKGDDGQIVDMPRTETNQEFADRMKDRR